MLGLVNMISEPTWAFIGIAIDCLECIPWAVRGLLRSVICQCRTTPIPCCITSAAGLGAWSIVMPSTPNTLNLKGVKIKDKHCSIMILVSLLFLFYITFWMMDIPGQLVTVHLIFSVLHLTSQSRPPFCGAGLSHFLVRDLKLSPHVWLHCPHASHSPKSPSIGAPITKQTAGRLIF